MIEDMMDFDLMIIAKITDLVVFVISFFGSIISGFSLASEPSNAPVFVTSLVVCIVSGIVLYFLSNN